MTENVVPDVITKASPPEVYDAMREASRTVLGAELARPSILVLLSQWALETGNGRAMHCNNIGNIKSVPGDGRRKCTFRCDEIIGGQTVWIEAGQPGSFFRAYETLTEGVADYLALLHAHFAGAWPDVVAGSVIDFARDLYAAHYYTASPELYAAGLRRLYAQFDGEIAHDVPYVPLAVAPIVDVSGDATGPGELPPA